jgi:hypothetical protein
MLGPRKNDPLVNIATSVMKEGDLRRGAEKLTNETLGVFSRRQLPHERHAEYDALLVQNVDEALGKAKTLTEDTQPVSISETRNQTLERFIREQKKYSKKDVADFKDFEHGDKHGGGKEKTYTHVHKTSGKEIVTTKSTHGSEWDLKEEDSKEVKVEKQKREIMKWYDRSHRKPGSPPRDPNQGDLFKNGKKK